MTAHAGWRRTEAGGSLAYVHPTLGRVDQVSKRTPMKPARWKATRPDGQVVRLPCNSDGSTYVPRAWHTDQDRPPVRYFPDPRFARRALGSSE